MKRTPKEVAIYEIESRIVTKEQAKERYKDWVKRASKLGVQSKEVTDFWGEVTKEIEKL